MTTAVTIFMVALITAAIREIFYRVKGREMFPANPRGPLYRWFGKSRR